MNFAPLSPELEQLIATLFAENKCACHVLNPNKTRILMWKEVQADQTTYHLRIGIQRFIAHPQVDRNGETYWRYLAAEAKPVVAVKDNNSPINSVNPPVQTDNSSPEVVKNEVPTPSDPITKFQARQAKTQSLINQEEPNDNSPTDHSAN